MPQRLLPLECPHRQLCKAVQRRIVRDKALKYCGKEIDAPTDKLLLVKLDINFKPSGESDAVVRNKPGEFSLRVEGDDATDHALAGGGVCDVVEVQDLLQRIFAFLNQ